ncbi:hypothetical protein BDQ17DRAFT_1368675 [Cyathus striatus]|nr:hypothetical protein BDQ17DRAFT_1368675 [Cyathus striatus]
MSNIADIPELNVCATRSATAKGTSLVNTNVIPNLASTEISSEDSEITPAQRPRRLIEAEEDEIVDFSGSDDKGEAMIMDNTGVEPAIREGKISASIIGDGSTPPNSNVYGNCEHTSKTFGVDSDVVPSSVVIDRDGTVSKNPSKSRKDNTETPYSTGVIAKGGTLLKKLSVNVVRSSESVRDPVLITDAHPSKVPAAVVQVVKASRNPVSSIQGLAHARTTATNKGKRRAELSDNSSNDIEMVDVPKGRHGTRVGTRKASGSTSKGNSNVIRTATNIPPVDVSSTYKEPIQQIPRKRKQRAQSEDLSDAKQPTPPVVPSDGLDISVSKHFVGYAMVNIVNPDDGDLKMVPHILQRPESVSLVKQLYENGNGATGGSGLQRTNPTMALSVLVDPTYIVTSSLTKSETGPFEQVEFTDKQGARIMTLVDGNHRKAALKEHANRLEVSEMREDIISKGSWLVRFYNEPAIKRSEIPNATMLALTGINNVKGAHQNSPQQMLLIDERDRDLAKRYSETLVSASNMDFKRLFSKGDELLNFLCQFWYFSSFHKLVIAPKEIIQLHQGGWAIFETIISEVGTYCASSVMKISLRRQIYNYFKNQMSPGASEYSHQRDRKAYSLLDMKLDALYVNGLAYGPGLLPVFPGGFPIFCPTMFQSLMYIMDELDLGLNVIATMITPGIGTVLGSKSAKLSSYIHYTSGTGGILYHLNYALWRSTSGWNDMSVDEKLSTNPNDDYGLPGSYYLDKAWLDIIQLIITHRHLYIYDGANTEQDDFIDEYVSIVIRDWRECSKREYPQPRDEPKWLASPVHNVHLLVEARGGSGSAKDFMLESIWKRNEPYHAPILWLLGKILKTLHLPELDLPFAPSLNVDETLYREAMRNSDIHTSYRTLTSAFQSLAKAISVRGIAGIPVTTTMRMRRVYKLHPAMASKLAALYNYTMEFGRDLWNQERIRESPNSTEESYNWLGVSSDISLHTGHQQNWNICSMRDAMVFYDINRLGIDFGRMLSNKTPTDENDKMDTVDEHDVTSDADDDDDDDDRQLNQSVTKMLSDGEGGADSSDIESTHGSGKGRFGESTIEPRGSGKGETTCWGTIFNEKEQAKATPESDSEGKSDNGRFMKRRKVAF